VRVYFRCPHCAAGEFLLDQRLGVAGRYSLGAQRLICLAGASWSYDIASARLEEFCGLSVSDTTIRELSQRTGAEMLAWQRTQPEAVRAFRTAGGDVEFTTDGTSVNTTEGWREMKLGIFSKRQRGAPAAPEQWKTRTLPAPQVRVAFAAIEGSADFGARWGAWRGRLGLTDGSGITLLADGAKWIWEQQRMHLRHAEGVLDVFHVLEHVAQTGRALFEETRAAMEWSAAGGDILLAQGGPGLLRYLQQTAQEVEDPSGSVPALRNYLAGHERHLDYPTRLAEGRSIGSGQVEGACRHMIGRRLKQSSARWRVRRVNRMAGLCSVMYSDQWTPYWDSINP